MGSESGSVISVCVPARNEERLIAACLESIRNAEQRLGEPVEIIVILNRCTDRTEEIARSFGAVIVHEDAKNLSKIRNMGAKHAQSPILVTIDADCRMSPNMLLEVKTRLDSGKVIGGGVLIKPERLSLGIFITSLVLGCLLLPLRVSAGLFWCRLSDFERVGGFDEDLLTGEDVDFALRLKRLGRSQNKRFATILRAHIIGSCRKFDEFGDWYLMNPILLWKLASGRNRREADRLWYNVKR